MDSYKTVGKRSEEVFIEKRSKFIGYCFPVTKEEAALGILNELRARHISRLQAGECTIHNGFVFSDLITNFERVADHCSNIGSCIVEVSTYGALDMHRYLADLRRGNENYEQRYHEYKRKYTLE